MMMRLHDGRYVQSSRMVRNYKQMWAEGPDPEMTTRNVTGERMKSARKTGYS